MARESTTPTFDRGDAEVERVLGLGARRVADRGEADAAWTVLLDVRGDEVCVV